jgi:hypothetical protein
LCYDPADFKATSESISAGGIMDSAHIFISHASKDDDFVKELRMALEGHQLPVWVDSRNLRGGAKLAPEISKANRRAQPEHNQLALGAPRDSTGASRRKAARQGWLPRHPADVARHRTHGVGVVV